MGLGPSKNKIKQILQKSDISNTIDGSTKVIKAIKDYLPGGNSVIEESSDRSRSYSGSDSSLCDSYELSSLTDDRTKVKEPNMYPYTGMGYLTLKYSGDDVVRANCFKIFNNVIITHSSNLKQKTGEEPKEVWCKINGILPGEKKDDTDLGIQINMKTMQYRKENSELVGFVSPEDIRNECFGVEMIQDNAEQDHSLVSFVQTDKGAPILLHELNIPLNDSDNIKGTENINLAGSPVYSIICNSEAYIHGYVDGNNKIRKITQEDFAACVEYYKIGVNQKKKHHTNIEEGNITKLDLSRNDFGPLDIKYLSEFNLSNLEVLDLSSNSIKPQGAFYLSQGKYPKLKVLNLNFNEIGDEGISHISNAFFNALQQLFLFHNNISSNGVTALCKADFIPNLVILSLSENPNITDEGAKLIYETKNWNNLVILNMNRTGLTDRSIQQLKNSTMPKLKKIHLNGNVFTTGINPEINSWKLSGINISYDNKAKKGKK